ncbi:hypothetical protein COW91_03220 [Candidatus Nomurabacteria bacterium CG22_combo_CG10-13_8_21_14_all_32_8]|uniref:Uncharacterized protein n=1 Tax=Candidatus Nomurabacteria bacterium CG22_combo_CG10-13_8_21_14_all_32_8 TaxID=1974732 RepID=A0A2H0CH94_9BACT|nr:MAG: hypothetical protein COW91_03220 [Candidatus Nomurabacteria bacterium CG22_combo_CG10-13_8_21_14_all_32_8]
MEIIGLTLNTLGTILIAYTVLRVHARVSKDRKIDTKVISEMQKERMLGILGIILIIIGYIIQLSLLKN